MYRERWVNFGVNDVKRIITLTSLYPIYSLLIILILTHKY